MLPTPVLWRLKRPEAGDGGSGNRGLGSTAAVEANLAPPEGTSWAQAWGDCVDPNPLPSAVGPGNCVSFDFALKQVRVTVPPRPVPSVFAGAIGASPPAASATSTASWGVKVTPSVGSCALCVLGSYSGGIESTKVAGGDAAVGDTLWVPRYGTLRVTGVA